MNYKIEWYTRDFQKKAYCWWCSLSINEQREFEQKYGRIYTHTTTLPSEVAEYWDKEGQPVARIPSFTWDDFYKEMDPNPKTH